MPIGTEPRSRRISVDLLRGLAVLLMILVNHIGTGTPAFRQLLHASWHGWTLADLVFPIFLFVVGVSIPLALGPRLASGTATRAALARKSLRRAAILVGIGLLLHAFPFWTLELARWRFPGVLQRIGLVYLGAALTFLYLDRRQRMIGAFAILALYWLAMLTIPVPGFGAGELSPTGNLAAWIDQKILGSHTWRHAPGPGDPEGLLTTLPAIVTALLGISAGELLSNRALSTKCSLSFFVPGFVLLFTGFFLNPWIPINKQLWTPSFVLFTAGIGWIALELLEKLPQALTSGGLFAPLRWAGQNALALFVGSSALARLLFAIRLDTDSGRVHLFRYLFQSVYEPTLPTYVDSLAYASTFLLFWTFVAWWLDRKKIYIKI